MTNNIKNKDTKNGQERTQNVLLNFEPLFKPKF